MIREHSLASLVTLGPEGLIANQVPLILDPDAGPLGTLRGHLSRMNSQWRDSLPEVPALAIFQGHSAYITPSASGLAIETPPAPPGVAAECA